MKMDLSEITKAVAGELSNPDDAAVEVTSVAFDSRKLKPQALFVPLLGENDGHDFIESAISNGAAASFWANSHKEKAPKDLPLIFVDNPLKSMQALAKYYLAKINPKVIAVTGSNGKTTTKDLIASVAATDFNVVKTQANFNNEIGVPVTILSMSSMTEVLVVEMGMDRPGQLKFLSNLVNPDIAVITMIGEAHIEFFGTRDKIADAKLEITDGLTSDGYFVYDGDEPLLRKRAQNVDAICKTFGRETTDDIYATDINDGDQQTKFKTNLWKDYEFTINLIGNYNVNNALTALEVGNILEISPANMRTGLEHANFTENRTEWLKGNQGEMVLSDVYNSNPTAVKAVLKAFEATHLKGKRIVVLGDMLELGEKSAEMHAKLAENINPDSIAVVFLIGNDVSALDKTLQDKYTENKNLFYYPVADMQMMINKLREVIKPDDEVLLKASHGIHLEKVLAKLTGK